MPLAIVTGAGGHAHNNKRMFVESDWTNLADPKLASYDRSKVLAEKAAWDFVAENNGHRFDFAVVNPGFIIGPLLHDVEGTSAGVSV